MGVTRPLIATYDLTFARRAREIVGLRVALVFAWHFLPRDFPPRAAGRAEESLGIPRNSYEDYEPRRLLQRWP
jgi:hypothetical protein